MIKLSQEQALDEIAYRCFRDMADQDYITARTCYRLNLPANFNWCSLQAIEKYLKCLLLLHRVETKQVRHDLEKSLDKINALKIVNISSGFIFQDESIQFIKDINNLGKSRYLGKSTYVTPCHLESLDKCIFDIRRYAIKNIDQKYINKINDPSFEHFQDFPLNGFLELVFSGINEPAKKELLLNNFYYGSRVSSMSFSGQNMPACYMGMNDEELLELYEELHKLIQIDDFKNIKSELENNIKNPKV